MTDAAFAELEPLTCVKRACELLGKSRATLHRQRNPAPAAEKAPGGPRAPHPAALTAAEQAALLAVLDSERFADKSPAQVWAILLDEGLYLASVRTMYRVLTLAEQVRERRAQAQHPPRVRPELVADGPDQVLDLGHHQTERTMARHLLRLVPDDRHLLPQSHSPGGA